MEKKHSHTHHGRRILIVRQHTRGKPQPSHREPRKTAKASRKQADDARTAKERLLFLSLVGY